MSVCSSLLAWLISCNFSKIFPLCRQENPQCCFQGTQVIFRLLFLWLLLFLMFQYHYSQKKIVFSICSNLFFVVWLFCRTARGAVDFSTEETCRVCCVAGRIGHKYRTHRTQRDELRVSFYCAVSLVSILFHLLFFHIFLVLIIFYSSTFFLPRGVQIG